MEVATDEIQGTQVTFQECEGALSSQQRRCPLLEKAQVRQVGFVRGHLESVSGSHRGNAMGVNCEGIPAAGIVAGSVKVFRFVGLGGDGGSFDGGLTLTSSFGSSWAMRSITQTAHGNLCAQGAERVRWGDAFDLSGVLDLYVEVLSDYVLNVYTAVNNVVQGHAFSLDFSAHKDLVANLRPVVTFPETARNVKVAIVEFEAVPVPSTRAYATAPAITRTKVYGTWELDEKTWPDVHTMEGTPLTIHVHEQGVDAKIAGPMRVDATFKTDGSIASTHQVSSARMMAPPQFRESEEKLKEFLAQLSSYELHNSVLTINGETKFLPATGRTGPPVTANPFF